MNGYGHTPKRMGAKLGQNTKHIGLALREARLAQGLSHADIAAVIKIQPQFLSAIENLSKDDLPSAGYVLGYVRSYAKFLGLDGGKAVAQYKIDSEISGALPMRDRPHFVPRRKIRLPRAIVPATMVLAVAGMLTLWYGTQTETQAAAPTTVPDLSIAEAASIAVHVPAAMTAPDMLTIRALAPSWIQIKDARGDVVISRIFVTGETWQTPRGSGASLSARDGGAVRLYVGDLNTGALGEQGVALLDMPLPE